MTADNSAAAADLLDGMPAIAAFLGLKVPQARHLSDKGILPTFKLDGYRNTCARRSTLTAWLAAQEARATHRGESPTRHERDPELVDDDRSTSSEPRRPGGQMGSRKLRLADQEAKSRKTAS